ncbi:MAG: hypothetical protein QM831_28190 [Kofleriaceae bacterium]
MLSITAGTSCFDRAGKRLVSIERDGISVLDLKTHEARRFPLRGVRSIAAFDDQWWAVTEANYLVRMDYDGRRMSGAWLEMAHDGVLIASTVGCASCAWTCEIPVVITDDRGWVTAKTVVADLALPLDGDRNVLVRGRRMVMPGRSRGELAPSTDVLGGTVANDGASVVLLVAHGKATSVIVVSVESGTTVQRFAMPSREIRVAPREMIAIARVDRRTLGAWDLATGIELERHTFAHAVTDFAVDPAGSVLAVRTDAGIELVDRRNARRIAA